MPILFPIRDPLAKLSVYKYRREALRENELEMVWMFVCCRLIIVLWIPMDIFVVVRVCIRYG